MAARGMPVTGVCLARARSNLDGTGKELMPPQIRHAVGDRALEEVMLTAIGA